MILVIAEVTTQAETIEALVPAMTVMEQASNAEEGCLSYVFTRQITNPNKLTVVETWQSPEALRVHFQTAHMAAFNAAMAGYPKPDIQLTVRKLGDEIPHP